MAWSKRTFIDPPTFRRPAAFILFIVDIFFPGIGTIIAGIVSCSCETLIVGILQLLTACIIIGWVWSILWGWELLEVARARRRRVDLPGHDHLGPDALL